MLSEYKKHTKKKEWAKFTSNNAIFALLVEILNCREFFHDAEKVNNSICFLQKKKKYERITIEWQKFTVLSGQSHLFYLSLKK